MVAIGTLGLLLGPLIASAGTVEPVPLTDKVNRGDTTGGAKIQGHKKALLSERTPTGTWTNQASYELKQDRGNFNLRGTYGKLFAQTKMLVNIRVPGGTVPRIIVTGAEAQTNRTTGSLVEDAKTKQDIGTSQRSDWKRIASVCTDVILRPDKCSDTFEW